LVDASLIFSVPWSMRPLYSPSLGRCVPYILRPFVDASLIFSVPWSMRPLYSPSLGRCVPYILRPLDGASLTDMSRPWIAFRRGIIASLETQSNLFLHNVRPSSSKGWFVRVHIVHGTHIPKDIQEKIIGNTSAEVYR
jgi:hypothetical protein